MRLRHWILWVVLGLPFGVPDEGIAQVDDAPSLAGVIDIHVISTDLGQPGRVNYAQAFQMAMTILARSGFSQAEIDMMTKHNPARFLGLK